MKNALIISGTCLLLFAFFSCTKNNNETITGGTLTATVNGSSFVSASVSEQAISSGLSSGVRFINVFSATDSSKTHNIILYVDSLSVGTYTYNSNNSNALLYTSGTDNYTTIPGSTGSITITSLGANSNTITGTFTGVAYIGKIDSVVITNGVFTNCVY